MPFQSQAQWKWAFANKKPFAREWADKTPVKLSQLPAYSKKAATRGDFSAGAGEVIGGGQCRDAQGHFINCDDLQKTDQEVNPTSSMAAWNDALERQRIIDQQRKKLRKAEILAELGLAPKKTGAGKISPEERKRQERESQKRNEGAAHTKVGPGGRLGAYLSALADPDNPAELPNLVAMQLQELGLVSPSRFGRFFITGEGRAYINAARSGDMGAAREAMLRARESAAQQADDAAAQAEQQQLDAENRAFQQQIEAIEGTPQERRLLLAQKRREDYEKQQAGETRKPKAQPKPQNNTYGTGKVIAGSPKSTVKSYEYEEEEMPYHVPSSILKNMVVGYDFAEHHGLDHEGREYARKAMRGEPFRLDDMRRLKSLHESINGFEGSRERPSIEWVARQLMGGAAGYNWIDSVVTSYEHEMSRYKSSGSASMKPSMAASVNAIRGLDLQYYFSRGGSAKYISLGRKIANREEMDIDDIRAIKKYLEAHEGDRTDDWGNPADPTPEYIDWMIHGGDEGLEWANGRLRSIESVSETTKGLGESMIPSQSASSDAIRGLDLQFYFKRGGNVETIALARKIANRKELDVDDVRTMHAYFNRHDGDRTEGWANPADPSVAYINWMLHGGDAGLEWSNGQIERLKLKREKPQAPATETVKAERKYLRANERAAAGAANYVFPEERKFEITDAASVTNAINSWPQYRGIRKYEEFRKRLTDLAMSKGFSSYLPKAWMREANKNMSALKSFRRAYAGLAQAEKLLQSEKARASGQSSAIAVLSNAPQAENTRIPKETSKELVTVKDSAVSVGETVADKVFAEHVKNHLPAWDEMSIDEQMAAMGNALVAASSVVANQAPSQAVGTYKQSPFNWEIMDGAEYDPEPAKTKELLKVVEYKGKGKNTPSNPRLWRQAISEAKKRYAVYPSAYANQFAAKWYKKNGGKWSSEKEAAGILL